MTSGSLSSNAVDLRECSSNLFTLADINALNWCKYTGAPCSLDSPLDDPVLISFATALENNVLCSWRHSPSHTTQRLNQGLKCSESSKELWLFWYGDDPRSINIVDNNLKETEHGSWENHFPNEAKVLLFKALHNTLERHLLSRNYVRVGKWFVNLDKKSLSDEKNKLFFSFSFCLQGEGKICLTVDVNQLPGVRHIVPNDLARASQQDDFKVILAPYGIQATLTGHTYQHNSVGVSKLLEDWKRFFPLHVVDDWTSVPEGIEHDVPVVVGVKVGTNFIKCPSHYVLVSVDEEFNEDYSSKPFLTPPPSPFTRQTAEQKNQQYTPTTSSELQTKPECTSKVSDSKAVACELVNEAWKDIATTKSTSKSSGVTAAQNKAFGANFKSDQESFWNLKEPLNRKSCSCTSSSNISRSRTTTPNRPFGINRPTPSGGQNTHNALASKIKKERERKPILPFHQRVGKIRNINPVSKGLSTRNLTTNLDEQNRQPNSQNEAKSTESTDGVREKPKLAQPFTNDSIINNNNNNNDETFFKPTPPVPTRLSEVVKSGDSRKKPLRKEDVYWKSRKSTPDVWKCYDVFTTDPKLKPTLPDDVLDFRDGEKLPLTTGSAISMPENSEEVFKIETMENKSYINNKRSLNDENTVEVQAPAKRMRRSSSASQSGRNKPETVAAVKPRGHKNSSSSKLQMPAPSPEPTNSTIDIHDSVFLPAVPGPRGRTNSTSSTGSAASPAPNTTSSKTGRNAKARRQSRKSQDKKHKEIKQEQIKQEPDSVLPFLSSPPTPRGSVSLRTEKDLQVTISDLDKLFDSPDEDEEDSKSRQLSVFTDNHSPPVQHDEPNQKTKTTVSNGPGVVSHADLVRMFPTPPMLDNHPHSPQPTNNNMAPTPPEVCGQSGQSNTDVIKNMTEEINDILTELKEMPPVFEVPTEETYLCSSSAIAPVQSLPSARLPPVKLIEDMVYTPSPLVKSASSNSDSGSPTTPFAKTRLSLSSIPTPDIGSGAIAISRSSSQNVLSPTDASNCTQGPKSVPECEKDCNLLNANLFLSDSYINYTSDMNLDGTNVCMCISGERRVLNRQTMGKEPMGFPRNNDVCQCGLGIFEREKLLQHTGLFSKELLHVNSCMENIGVELDTRYCDTAKRKSTLVKKEPITKDSKSGQCAELLGTSNSSILVENLLDQFSSPLAASATSERLLGISVDNADNASTLLMKSASDVEKFSKVTVDFLMHLKPVIQESLHKAIHWKTWDQLSTVQGPLSLKQLCQMNSKGPVCTGDPARIPRVIVGHDRDWLSVSPLALHHWEKIFLEPYTSSRDITYIVLAPENETTNTNVKYFFRELSSTYETCHLGRHVPVSKFSSMSGDGILRIGPKQQAKYGKNVVSSWFGKYENLSEGPRVKLFAQVCKYELGPFLEKFPLEKLTSLGDDGSKRNDSICDSDQPPQDNASIVVYLINPFDECSDQVVRRESYYALLRSFSEMASGLPEKIRSRLVLEIIPLRQITQVDAYQKTKGSLVSFVKLLKTTAFSVFSRCRLVLQKPYHTRIHTGFWATSSQRLAIKNQASDRTRTRVYFPAFILATPTKLIHNLDTVETADDLTSHKESSSLLFCCYGLSEDQRWLLASCTNETGLVMETFVTVVEPFGLPAKQRRTRLRIKALRRLWEFCQGVTSTVVSDWRLVIGKLGRFSRHELRDWDEIIRSHSPSECTDRCDACSSLRSHARFQSVSVVSLHNELCLRLHLARVTSAFNNYREPDTTIVESVSRQRISTSIIVINIENTQSGRLAQLDGIHDVDDRGALVDGELMMSEPNAEDDDEMPMMPLFGTIGGIFPSPRMSHLHQDIGRSSPNERPSSAPMLTDPVTSSFVPIGLHSPHPSQSACSEEQNEQEKNFGFPLAHGRIYTTAPLGTAFKQFSRDDHVDGNSPVVLKAALLLHRVDETGRQGNHVLSSNTFTNVLRYILEQYDALSWLTVDSVSEDRTSCLPVHYITLSQMSQAFNGLLC